MMKSLPVLQAMQPMHVLHSSSHFFLLFVYINVAKTHSSVRPSEIKCHIKIEEDRFAQWKSIFQIQQSIKRVISEHTVTPVLQRLKWNTFYFRWCHYGKSLYLASKPLSRCVSWNNHFIQPLNGRGMRLSESSPPGRSLSLDMQAPPMLGFICI